MAEARISVNPDQFICAVCLDLLKDPVTIPCGHSFCKNELKEKQIKSQQKIQEKQKKVQELKQTVDIIKKRSQAAVDDNEKIFNEMISSLVKRCSEVTEMIRVQEKADLSRAEQHLKHLEQEITDLQRRVSDLEQLSHTPDHIHFLQSFPSLCVSPGCDDSPSFTVNQHLSFDGVRKSVSDLKKRVEEICQEEFNKIRPQDFCYLTLDPNTAHPQLILSEKNRVVTRSDTKQRYSDHPERFDYRPQVLCKESVCGLCYWEVEWSGRGVDISVSYKEISRNGRGFEHLFGHNSQSWSLSQAFKKHKLVEACVDLQEKICSQHNKLMEIYCRTDQSFICYLCMMDKHKGHDTVSTTAERSKKQNELKEEQIKYQQRIQEKQKKVQDLKQTVDTIKKRSQAAVDDNEKIFNEVISSLVKRCSEVTELIRFQEKADLSRAEQHLKHLEQEITDLQRRVSDLEQLSHTPDHIHFLRVTLTV
ncbi:finTRIM family, member 16 isoform X1 [Silurus meridionalis]|nr:finTRIM family, member 16 isoform X1 [Silurus meridionalis]